MSIRSAEHVLFEFPGHLRWNARGVDGTQLAFLEGPRLRSCTEPCYGSVVTRLPPLTNAVVWDGEERLWIGCPGVGEEANTLEATTTEPERVVNRIPAWHGDYGVSIERAATGVGFCTRTAASGASIEAIELLDFGSRERRTLCAGRLPHVKVVGPMIVAWSKGNELSVFDSSGGLRWSRCFPATIGKVHTLERPEGALLIVALKGGSVLCLSLELGTQHWAFERERGTRLRGSDADKLWLTDENGELFARATGSGAIVQSYGPSIAAHRDGWVHSSAELMLEAGPFGFDVRRMADGKIVHRLQLPEHLQIASTGFLSVSHYLVVQLVQRDPQYRGSAFALLWLDQNALARGAIEIEPRPQHTVSAYAREDGARGYRVATRAKDLEQLLRMGQILVQQLAYEKGDSPFQMGDREFDGSIEFAFDPQGLPIDAAARVEQAVQDWTGELAGVIAAYRGHEMVIRHVPFSPEMLAL